MVAKKNMTKKAGKSMKSGMASKGAASKSKKMDEGTCNCSCC